MFADAHGKEFKSIQGRKATVIKDLFDFFKEGNRVVILEEDDIPCCVGVESYEEGCNNKEDYDDNLLMAMHVGAELIIEGDEE